MDANPRGYMRTVAFTAIITTSIYAGLVVAPDFLGAKMADIVDPLQIIPRLYVLAIFLLSLSILQQPANSGRSRRAIRGILEGAILAYALIAVHFVLRVPEHDIDRSFHWASLYVSLSVLGPLLSALGALAHLLYLPAGRNI